MKNIFLLYIIVTAICNCAIIPENLNVDAPPVHKTGLSAETKQDYGGIETTESQEAEEDIQSDRENPQRALKTKRCPSPEVVSSFHRFPSNTNNNLLSVARRDINLMEKNRQRCENCRKMPICAKDINKCINCKRICELVESTSPQLPSTTPENMVLQAEELLPIQVRFGDDPEPTISSPPAQYLTIGAVNSGPTMDLIAQLFDVENQDKLDQFIIVGKLKQSQAERGRSLGDQLMIWDFAKIFTNDGSAIIPQIETIDTNITNNTKKVDLAELLNVELDKAIKNKKKELGKNRLSRDEIDSLINSTMSAITKRNETVGCSLEDEDSAEIYPISRNHLIKPVPPSTKSETAIHIDESALPSNPPVIQSGLDSTIGADNPAASDLETLTIADPKPILKSDSHTKLRTFSDSIEETVGSNEQPIPNLPSTGVNSRQGLEDDLQQIIEDSLKTVDKDLIPQSSRPSNLRASDSNASPGQAFKIINDGLKIPSLVNSPKDLEEDIKEIVEDGLRSVNKNLVSESPINTNLGDTNPVKSPGDPISKINDGLEMSSSASNSPTVLENNFDPIIEDQLKTFDPNILGKEIFKQPNLSDKIQEVQKPLENRFNNPNIINTPRDSISRLINNGLGMSGSGINSPKPLEDNIQQVVQDGLKTVDPNILRKDISNHPQLFSDGQEMKKPLENKFKYLNIINSPREEITKNGLGGASSDINLPKILEDNVHQTIEDSLKTIDPNILKEEIAREPNLSSNMQEIQKPLENKFQYPHMIYSPKDQTINDNLAVSDSDVSLPKTLEDNVHQTIQDSLKTVDPNILEDDIFNQPNLSSDIKEVHKPFENRFNRPNIINLPREQMSQIIDDASKMSDSAVNSPQNLEENIHQMIDDNLKIVHPNILGAELSSIEEAQQSEAAQLENRFNKQNSPVLGEEGAPVVYEGMPIDEMPKVFPYHIARPMPNTIEYAALPAYQGMPVERMPKVLPYHLSKSLPHTGPLTALKAYEGMPIHKSPQHFPYHIAKPFAGLPETDQTTIIPQLAADVEESENLQNRFAEVVERRLEDPHKYKSFGSIIPLSSHPDANTQKVYFLGKDIGLPLTMIQDSDGTMQLSVDMERLCNCKNETCPKRHTKDVTEEEVFEPSVIHSDTTKLSDIDNHFDEASFKKNAEIFKRSPVLNDLPKDWGSDMDEKYDQTLGINILEGQLNNLNENIEKFEEENKELLSQSTKSLLQNVETADNVKKTVKIVNKLLEFMRNVAAHRR